jgi:general stress protein 26
MVTTLRVATPDELKQDFLQRVNTVIWCNASTVDTQGRPRSRIVHPVWEDLIGWITTRRHSPKEKHLAQTPFMSLAYIADLARPVYADCRAVWIDDLAEKQRVWNFVSKIPPPLGFDPAPIYHGADHPDFGLLKLTPWRIELANLPDERKYWQA